MSLNLYRQLRELLPEPALTVATVASTHTDGTVTVTYPGGAQQRVRGTATVGQNVFVRAGQIEGAAPALTTITIEV